MAGLRDALLGSGVVTDLLLTASDSLRIAAQTLQMEQEWFEEYQRRKQLGLEPAPPIFHFSQHFAVVGELPQ